MSIATRPKETQAVHDDVADVLKRELVQLLPSSLVFTNPGEQREHAVAGVFPDIVVKESSNGADPTLIFEVETADSMNEAEVSQWVAFAKLARSKGIKFYLVIPVDSDCVANTAALLSEYKVEPAGVITYEASESHIAFDPDLLRAEVVGKN